MKVAPPLDMSLTSVVAALGLSLLGAGCGESPAGMPDEAFASARAPQSGEVALAGRLADRWIDEHPAEELGWGWGAGTLLSGVDSLYRVTGSARYRSYLADYAHHWANHGIRVTKSDDCIPAIAALEVQAGRPGSPAGALVDEVLHYLYVQAPRTKDGGISHFGAALAPVPTLWVDSLFMFGTVLNGRGEVDGDELALDTYGQQLGIFARHLQHDAGFFQHAYAWPTSQDPSVFWGRGNGWVLASGGQYLLIRASRGEHDPEAEAVITLLARATIDAQDPATGLYWTVLNRPGETYLETSATALLTAGLARGYRAGVLGASVIPAIKRGMSGIQARIAMDAMGRPYVTGTSTATAPGTFATYAALPVKDDVDYGLGAVLLALVEVSGLIQR